MEWLNDLLWSESVAHTVLMFAFIIAAGTALGKIKIFGISLLSSLFLFIATPKSPKGDFNSAPKSPLGDLGVEPLQK